MGEVFRALDSRLHREVAVKILPPTVADDPDRRARFDRESRAVAALSVNGRLLLGQDSNRTWQVVDLASGALRAAAGLQPTDSVAGWSNDGTAAFVARLPQVPARLERVNLQTGVRTFIRELAPPDSAGVSVVVPSSIIDDGRGYAYFYIRDVATWYVVQDSGLGR